MEKEKINICVVTTAYSFLLYLLINEYNENDIFIFGSNFPKELSKNIKHTTIPKIVFKYKILIDKLNSFNGIYANMRGYVLYFYTYLKLRLILTLKTINKEVLVYGHAQTPFSFMFYENKNSNIIEDGVENYVVNICEPHKINKIIDTVLHIFGIYFLNMCETYGSHENIKNIYLTNEHPHPLIKDKVKVIDINKTWKSLSDQRKEEILNIFNVPRDIDFNGKTLLLLTQSFYEDGNATFNEEINMYIEMINKFDDEYQIIIKPHPRDKKDYTKLFPNAKVIAGYFPIELLTLIDINPTIVCSIASTALTHFKNSKIYVYEGKLNNELLAKSRKELLKIISEKNLELLK